MVMRIVLFILSISLSLQLKSQYVDLGICHPDSISNIGLTQFGEMVGDARLVIIGEQSHGVGTGYESASHLIKYLHEEKGFNVVLQEFCFYSFGEIQKNAAENSAQAYRTAMYWPQGKAKEYDALLDYIDAQRGEQPLMMEGFDPRIFQRKAFYKYCDSLLTTYPWLIEDAKSDYLKTLDNLLKLEYQDSVTTIGEKERFILESQNMAERVQYANPDKRLKQHFINLIGYANNSWNFEGFPLHDVHRFSNRFLQMANNIFWLTEEMYPEEKFVLLMHNGHAAKNIGVLKGSIPDSLVLTTPNLGEMLANFYGDDCKHIATTFYTGSYCKWDYQAIEIPSPSKKSIEFELNEKGLRFGYCELDKDRDYHFFFNDFNEWVDVVSITAKFGQLFDGVIFIDEGQMPTPIE